MHAVTSLERAHGITCYKQKGVEIGEHKTGEKTDRKHGICVNCLLYRKISQMIRFVLFYS